MRPFSSDVVRAVASLLALAALVAACGGGQPVKVADLKDIMPRDGDAPPGTSLLADQSGKQSLRQIVRDEDTRQKLTDLGFKGGWNSRFSTPNPPEQLATAPPGTIAYASFAIVLKDEENAQQGFDFYSERLRGRAKGFTPLVSDKEIGAQTLAFRFASLENTPLPGVAYLFRVGNALFGVVGIGNPAPDANATRALAEKIATRAGD